MTGLPDPATPLGRPQAQRRARRSTLDAVLVGMSALVALVLAGCALLPPGSAGSGTDPSAAPLATPGIAPVGEVVEAEVLFVIDGDTIVVELGGRRERIRYIGIDAPEAGTATQPAEPLADTATEANERLVAGRTIHLERDRSETDRFGRLLRHAWLDDGAGWHLVTLELVAAGLADARTYRPDTRWDAVLADAEDAARDARLGIWAGD